MFVKNITYACLVALISISSINAYSSSVGESTGSSEKIRVKDLGRLQGWRDNPLVGYGIVSGLAGSGDSSSNRAARQAMSNLLAQFNQAIPADQLQSRNVAMVMVTASLPVFSREGDMIDVTVTSTGDARSLLGGTLLLTPLRAANGRTYVLAQGALSVGGYRYDSNGNVTQKNHPTVGIVPGGGVVEIGMQQTMSHPGEVTFVLNQPDYTTADRVANAINTTLSINVAYPRDAAGIEIQIPEGYRKNPVPFFAQLESVLVQPDRRAKVVVNERTGTIVSGGDVRLQRVAVSHGELRVSIAAETSVSQPGLQISPSPGIRTATITNTQVSVAEGESGGAFLTSGATVADLVQALSRLRVPTRDIIAILLAVKSAGALHAELIIQ